MLTVLKQNHVENVIHSVNEEKTTLAFRHDLAFIFGQHQEPMSSSIQLHFIPVTAISYTDLFLDGRVGLVVRALAFHQCGPSSISAPGVICGLS